MKSNFPLFLLIGAVCTAAAVVLLTPDPTNGLLNSSSETARAVPTNVPSRQSPEPAPAVGWPVLSRADAVAGTPDSLSGGTAPQAMPSHLPPQASAAVRPSAIPMPRPAELPKATVVAAVGVAIPSPDAATNADEEIVVPLGASLPVSLVDVGEGVTQAQMDVLDRIADDFVREVSARPAGGDPVPRSNPEGSGRDTPRPSDWDTATRTANERYRVIFGDELYNAWTAQAAKEALLERQNATAR